MKLFILLIKNIYLINHYCIHWNDFCNEFDNNVAVDW
jgi:hypothetical protein